MSSKVYLFKDSETTDFKKNGPLIQPGQGRVCQIALLLTDDTGRSLAEVCCYVKPDGWKIGEGAGKVNGITDDTCDKFGITQKSMVMLYHRLASMASLIVCHNSDFDSGMLQVEEAYAGLAHHKGDYYCTMKQNTDVLKIPHSNGRGYKWPKLEECLKHYTGRQLGSFAHDAMYDVKACRDIFFEMKNRGIYKQAA